MVFTYLLPAVPFVCSFDGIVSRLRAYSPEELPAMTAKIQVEDYTRTIGQAPVGKSAGNLTYAIGVPKD